MSTKVLCGLVFKELLHEGAQDPLRDVAVLNVVLKVLRRHWEPDVQVAIRSAEQSLDDVFPEREESQLTAILEIFRWIRTHAYLHPRDLDEVLIRSLVTLSGLGDKHAQTEAERWAFCYLTLAGPSPVSVLGDVYSRGTVSTLTGERDELGWIEKSEHEVTADVRRARNLMRRALVRLVDRGVIVREGQVVRLK